MEIREIISNRIKIFEYSDRRSQRVAKRWKANSPPAIEHAVYPNGVSVFSYICIRLRVCGGVSYPGVYVNVHGRK